MSGQTPKNPNHRFHRRDFLKTAAASGGAAVCGSLLAGCQTAATVPAGRTAPASGGGNPPEIVLDLTKPEYQSLASVGGTLALDANTLDSKGMLLYRSGDATVLVFSRKCTHQGCAVGEFQNGIASCPCHGSQFDTGGKAVKGPAQSSLANYTATISGSTVTVRGG